MQTAQGNERMGDFVEKAHNFVQDEQNQQKLEIAISYGVYQLKKAQSFASEHLASQASIM